MNGKLFHRDSSHCSDEQLLLYVDGELPLLHSIRVRAHLAACSECRARRVRVESVIGGFAEARHHSHEPAMDASGPRALLTARLAESAHDPQHGSRIHLRYARALAYACALVLLVASGFAAFHHSTTARLNGDLRLLPDPGFTPGATRAVALADLCSTDDEVVRDVPSSLQKKIFQEYGIRGVPAAEFEVDYLITPGLGGSDDVRNLWPEPHSNTVWNSYVKDQLEDHLHRMVCERKISLNEAQKEIASNWIEAYKKYFHTQEPRARLSPSSEVEAVSEIARTPLFLSPHSF
jgi:Putative zinc-finger